MTTNTPELTGLTAADVLDLFKLLDDGEKDRFFAEIARREAGFFINTYLKVKVPGTSGENLTNAGYEEQLESDEDRTIIGPLWIATQTLDVPASNYSSPEGTASERQGLIPDGYRLLGIPDYSLSGGQTRYIKTGSARKAK